MLKIQTLNAHAANTHFSGVQTLSNKPNIGTVYAGDKEPSTEVA